MRADDLVILERELGRLEKKWRGWRIIRWLILPLGLIMLGLGSYGTVMILNQTSNMLLSASKDVSTRPVMHYELHSSMGLSTALIGGLVFQFYLALLGMWILCYVLSNWRRQEINQALSRVLREKLEEVKNAK